jgi:hypothetical protein
VDCRFTIVEHITSSKKPKSQVDPTRELISEYAKQDEDVRLLAYRLLVDKFNEKYKTLSQRQKNILKEYINNVSNTVTLKTYVLKEADLLKKTLSQEAARVSDKVTRIKLDNFTPIAFFIFYRQELLELYISDDDAIIYLSILNL